MSRTAPAAVAAEMSRAVKGKPAAIQMSSGCSASPDAEFIAQGGWGKEGRGSGLGSLLKQLDRT